MSVTDEREGTENNQWRREASASRRLDGGPGEAALPPVERRAACSPERLLRRPLGHEKEELCSSFVTSGGEICHAM